MKAAGEEIPPLIAVMTGMELEIVEEDEWDECEQVYHAVMGYCW